MIKIKRFEGSLGLIKFFSGLILFSFLFWSRFAVASWLLTAIFFPISASKIALI